MSHPSIPLSLTYTKSTTLVLKPQILGDLFPGVKLPELDYGHLLHALKDNAVRMGLQPLNSFMIKMIQ